MADRPAEIGLECFAEAAVVILVGTESGQHALAAAAAEQEGEAQALDEAAGKPDKLLGGVDPGGAECFHGTDMARAASQVLNKSATQAAISALNSLRRQPTQAADLAREVGLIGIAARRRQLRKSRLGRTAKQPKELLEAQDPCQGLRPISERALAAPPQRALAEVEAVGQGEKAHGRVVVVAADRGENRAVRRDRSGSPAGGA